MMRRLLTYVALPSVAPAAIGVLYLTPVSLVGCANRGLLALAVVSASLIAGILLGIRMLRRRSSGEAPSLWAVVAVVILATPALLVLGPLG